MTLIILLIVLVVERVALQSERWQASYYAAKYSNFVLPKLNSAKSSSWTVLISVAIPAVVVGLFLSFMDSNLLDFVVGLIVVAISVGNANARLWYRQYLNALGREDKEAQSIIQCKLTDSCEDLVYEKGEGDHEEQVEQAKQLNNGRETLGETLIWINFRYYAAPIFYFVLLGVPGIVFYSTLLYLCEYSKKHNIIPLAQQKTLFTWLEWLFWVPSRFVSLGFMIVGHFSNGLETWLKYAADFSISGREMLCQVAVKSEQYGEESARDNAQHMVKLTKRNMVLFLVVVALLTLYGQIV